MTDEDFRRLLALQTAGKPEPRKRKRGGLAVVLLVLAAMTALLVRHEVSMDDTVVAVPTFSYSPAPSPSVVVLPPIEIDEDPAFEDDRIQRIDAEHGDVVAHLTVPSLKLWDYPVRYGTGHEMLALGPALYPGSAAPGEGNFSMAGHRITPVGPFRTCSTGEWGTSDCHGPFRYVNELRRGDVARVTYHGETYRYEFVRTIIISPNNTSVLRDNRADMTFTACHPPGYATQRIVAQWRLVNG